MKTVKEGILASYNAYKRDNDKKTADEVAALPRPGGVAQRKGLEMLELELRKVETDAVFAAKVKAAVARWEAAGYAVDNVAAHLFALVREIPHG